MGVVIILTADFRRGIRQAQQFIAESGHADRAVIRRDSVMRVGEDLLVCGGGGGHGKRAYQQEKNGDNRQKDGAFYGFSHSFSHICSHGFSHNFHGGGFTFP